MEAILLDSTGSFLVDRLRNQFVDWYDESVSQQNMFMSLPMSPGESSWSISDQKTVFQLLDAKQIGLSLNESMLMVPMKTLSFVIGISDEKFHAKHKHRCEYCLMKNKCRYKGLGESEIPVH